MITIEHTPAEGTIIDGSSRGDGVWEIAKARGWRYSRQVGIYIPHSRDKAPKRGLIERTAQALREAGHEVDVKIDAAPRDAAEAHADKLDRLGDRADRLADRARRLDASADAHFAAERAILDPIPPGQPILVGHYSEGPHRRALARAQNHCRKGLDDYRAGQLTASRAEVAARNAEGRVDVGALRRRIDKHEAELRDIARKLTPCPRSGRAMKPEAIGRTLTCSVCYRDHTISEDATYPVHGAATGRWAAQLEERREYVQADLDYDRARLAEAEANGAKVWGPADFDKAAAKEGRQLALVDAYGWAVVRRVNAKSLSVESGYGWTNTAGYDKVRGAKVVTAEEAARLTRR